MAINWITTHLPVLGEIVCAVIETISTPTICFDYGDAADIAAVIAYGVAKVIGL